MTESNFNATAIATVLAVAAVPIYGVASIVYFLATVDATFIRKYEPDVTEVGTEVDLVLSFVAVVATEAWTVFV